jgi:hypothetical protein
LRYKNGGFSGMAFVHKSRDMDILHNPEQNAINSEPWRLPIPGQGSHFWVVVNYALFIFANKAIDA